MKKTFLIALAALLVMLPVIATAASMYVTTPSGGNVNMRKGPGTDYDVECHVPNGAKVTMHTFVGNDNWRSVSYNGHDGFIHARYLTETKPSSGGSGTSGDSGSKDDGSMFSGFQFGGYYASVVPATPGSFVNLRWAPSQSMPVQAKYYADQVVYVLKQNRSWCQVYDQANDRIGFMVRSMLAPYDGSGS